MSSVGDISRVRKGRNFCNDEERQVCMSVLHISQDPIQGNGQRKEAFWERVKTHFNQNRPSAEERPKRSLETKWGSIKHDVSKFIAIYGHCYRVRESGTSLDDILQNALGLYKVKDPKQRPFLFLHCWLLLKDCPRWMETPGERVDRSTFGIRGSRLESLPRRSMEAVEGNEGDPQDSEELQEEAEVVFTPVVSTGSRSKRPRPIGNKAAKEDQRVAKQREAAIRVQARATSDLAAANALKAETLRDQAVLSLFTMPDPDHLSEQARDYLEMRREEEMEKLKDRTQARREAKARLAAAATREARTNAAEVDRATANRVAPVPMAPRRISTPPEGNSPFSQGVRSPSPNPTFENDVQDGTQEFGQPQNDFAEEEGSPNRVSETEQDSPPLQEPIHPNAIHFSLLEESLCANNHEAQRHIYQNSLPAGVQAATSITLDNYTYPHQFRYFGGQAYSPNISHNLQGFGVQQLQAGRQMDSMADGGSNLGTSMRNQFRFG